MVEINLEHVGSYPFLVYFFYNLNGNGYIHAGGSVGYIELEFQKQDYYAIMKKTRNFKYHTTRSICIFRISDRSCGSYEVLFQSKRKFSHENFPAVKIFLL